MPLLTPVLAALGPWISRFLLAKGAMMFAGFLGNLGLVIAVNKYAYEPLTNLVLSKWSTLPGSMQCWFGVFGVNQAISIMLSAMTLITAKKIFFSKKD